MPSGYRPTDKDAENMATERSSYFPQPQKSSRPEKSRKIKNRQFQGYTPVYYSAEPTLVSSQPVKIKVKKQPRSSYDLIVTSKPEEVAIQHSKKIPLGLSSRYIV